MSRTALKKELSALDADQRSQILLDLYERCKEAREYLDFFVEPDVDALYLRYKAQLEKEIYRGKYGRCNARISYIRKIIKKYDSFGIGAESTIRFMEYALINLIIVDRKRIMSSTLVNGMAKLLRDMLEYGDKYGAFDTAVEAAQEAVDLPQASSHMKRFLSMHFQSYLDSSRDKT